MKNKLAQSLLAITATFWMPHSQCEAEDTLNYPAGLSRMIHEVIAVKSQAMKFEGMRHDELVVGEDLKIGVSGKKFQLIMDQIADYPIPGDILESVKKLQETEINAKIVVWALDRKKRAEKYKRFSEYYLNFPETSNDLIDHYLRGHPGIDFSEEDKKNILSLRVINPNQVALQDISEENRLILEYLYFSPPDGRKFYVDCVRGNLAQSLLSLKNYEKSLIVWTTDLEMALNALLEDENQSSGAVVNARLAIYPFVTMSTRDAFTVLGGYWHLDAAREAIRYMFQNRWTGSQTPFDEARYTAEKEHYDTWMALALENSKTPGERGFADWLKQQAPPKAPPPPKYAEDPSDPFLPQVPSKK
jgi:hypothetical protein